MVRAVDPDPRSRVRWERKMVIRQVQRGTNPYSKEPRAERIARTERALTSRSTFLPTSVKKLVHLAHQIQGKTVAEALVQMRFSKKKMAQEVKYQLELARDMAVAERGMGLGETQRAAEVAAGAVEGTAVKDVESIKIQDKDGKWVRIDDPTRMYIAEAWVNRGPLRGRRPDYRARGRVFIKEKPSTSEFFPVAPCLHVGICLTCHPQVSPSSSRRKRHGCVSMPTVWPRSSARALGSTSPTGPFPASGHTTRGRGLVGLGGVWSLYTVCNRQTGKWAASYTGPIYFFLACISNSAAKLEQASACVCFCHGGENMYK